jgi:methyl-accepting chemotaxis protein
MLIFSTLAVFEKYSISSQMQSISRMASLAVQVGGVVHELQKERGLSAGFLSSKGTRFSSELPAQRQLSDKALADFQKFLSAFPYGQFGPEFKATLDTAVDGLSAVVAKRKEVDTQAMETPAAIGYYSQSITKLLNINTQIIRLATAPEVFRSVTAYDSLLWAKEYAGRERATLNGAFAADKFNKGVYRAFLSVVSSQAERLEIFRDFGSKAQVSFFELKVSGPDVERVLALRLMAMDNNRLDSLGADPTEWFKVATVRIDLMHEVENQLAQDAIVLTNELGSRATLNMYLYSALTLAALLLTGIVGVLAFRSISGPLSEAAGFAEAVAGGNLNLQLTVNQGDEIGKLCVAMNTMVVSLKDKIAEAEMQTHLASEEARRAQVATDEANEAKGKAERAKAEGMIEAATQLEQVVEIVSSASEELSAQIEQSSRGTEVQSSRVGETATAMEEMNATVLEVARNASQAAESSGTARAKALEGSKVVAQVVAGIGTMQTVSLAMKEDMDVLGKQAEGIGQVMNVISDIADQTNLLALNAAIEAARAGDAGRGFAVVADEVRKLAEKTMTATKEVGEAISGIQKGTKKNLENVERAVSTVEQATALANKSGEALQEIVNLVDISTDQVRSIATASEEQSAASEEINRSIEDISRISSETASAMSQSAQAVGELATQAGTLRALIEKMKSGG